MVHELNPKGREDIEERRFLVITVGFLHVTGQTIALFAYFGIGLGPGE